MAAGAAGVAADHADNESQRFAALGLDADVRCSRPGSTSATGCLRSRRAGNTKGRAVLRVIEGRRRALCRGAAGGRQYLRMPPGLAFAGPGRPVVVFRNIFEGGVRDHAVMTFADPATPGEVRRVSNDAWQISACPHHGPSLSISPAGTYHVSWYTNGKARKGLFYARSKTRAGRFPTRLRLAAPTATHAAVRADGSTRATMVWKEFDGERTSVNAMISHDEGKSWSKPSRSRRRRIPPTTRCS